MKISSISLIFSLALFLSACWGEADERAKQKAKEVAETMETARDVTNARGDNRLKDSEINSHEQQLATVIDSNNQRKALCTNIILEVQALIMEKHNPDQFYTMAEQYAGMPGTEEIAEEMRKQGDEAKASFQESLDQLVSGSLTEWIYKYSENTMGYLGAEGNEAAYSDAHHECMQKPDRYIMNPHEKMRHH